MILSSEIPDPKPTSDGPASGNRRSVGGWFRRVMTKRSHHQSPRQTPSEVVLESAFPSQTEATPPNEKSSTMSPGRRQKVSAPFSVDTGHGCLITRLSGRLEGPLSNQRFVPASCPYEQDYLLCFTEESSPQARCVQSTSQDHCALRSWPCQHPG